jgi:hypothetical protein
MKPTYVTKQVRILGQDGLVTYLSCLFPNGKGGWHLQWVSYDKLHKKGIL